MAGSWSSSGLCSSCANWKEKVDGQPEFSLDHGRVCVGGSSALEGDMGLLLSLMHILHGIAFVFSPLSVRLGWVGR